MVNLIISAIPIVFFWIVLGSKSLAVQVEDLNELRAQTAYFVKTQLASQVVDAEQIDITVQPLDSRIRLSACPEAITFQNRYGSLAGSRLTIQAQCESALPEPWRVNLTVRLKEPAQVVFLRETLPRGHMLTADDLITQSIDIRQFHQPVYSEVEEVVGMVLKRQLKPNKPLSPNQVTPPKLVKKGERVKLKSGSERFQIETLGIALNDGALGESVTVKNLSSNRSVEGTVVANQTIVIGY